MHRTVVFNRSVFSRAFVVTGRCGIFALLACVVFFSIPKLPSYLACFSLCPLGFEASSFLMENSYLHPILCGNGKIRNFLILAWAILFAHSETAIVFGMLVLMSIKISSVQVSCLSRVLIPIPKKNPTFVSTYMLKFSEQCKIARKTGFYEHV